MIKVIEYNNTPIKTYEVSSKPYASMQDILESVVPGSWSDYIQVINSSEELVYDLEIICVFDRWLVPVTNVRSWLFSFPSRNMGGEVLEYFRVFRRDLEKVLRVAWALPVDFSTLVISKAYPPPLVSKSVIDIADIFIEYGLTESEISGIDDDNVVLSPINYIEYLACSTTCGPRGLLLCNQIQYIEDMPNSRDIINFINPVILSNLPNPQGTLDDYLDTLNALISEASTLFVGEF